VALLIEETKKIELNHNKSNQMLVFGGGKNRSARAKTSHNRLENLQIQSAYDGGSGNPKRHIGETRVLSPLRLPFSPYSRLLSYYFQDHPNILTNWIVH